LSVWYSEGAIVKNIFYFLQLFHTDRKAIYKREKVEGNLEGKWVYYNTKNDISDLVLSLNKRGIREKNLFENLIYVTKNEYLSY